MTDTLEMLNVLTPDSRAAQLLRAIDQYERQRASVEGWDAFVFAVERVEPEFYDALLKRWRDTPKRGRRVA